MDYEKKYLKYKKKYMMLQKGGALDAATVAAAEATAQTKHAAKIAAANAAGNPAPDAFRPFGIRNCNTTNDIVPCVLPIPKFGVNGVQNVSNWRLIRRSDSRGIAGEIYYGNINNDPQIRIIKYIMANPHVIVNFIPPLSRYVNNEICVQHIASTLGIAPRIIDYWTCEDSDNAVIVMEVGGSLNLSELINQIIVNLDNEHLNIFYTAEEDDDEDDNEERRVNRLKLKQLYSLYFAYKLSLAKIIKLNHNHIIHGDFHLQNIMVNLVNNIVTDVKIIDFGLSTKLDERSHEIAAQIQNNIANGNILDNIQLMRGFNELILQDYTKLLIEFNRLRQEFADHHRIARLEEFIQNRRINSIYYYYALELICEELNDHLRLAYANKTQEAVDQIIQNMYEDDIVIFIEQINDKIIGAVNGAIENINVLLNGINNLVNPVILRRKIQASKNQIIQIAVRT